MDWASVADGGRHRRRNVPAARIAVAGIASLALAAVVLAPATAADPLAAEVTAIIDQAATVRGIEPDARIRWRVLPRDEAMVDRLAELDKPDKLAATRVDDAILERLGLLPPGTDLDALVRSTLTGQLAGYYDPDTKELTVIAEDGVLKATDRATLAHEAVHALQDQRWDLRAMTDAIPDEELDRELAIRALIEGDATLGMTMWASRYGQDLAGAEEPEIPEGASMEELPPVLAQSLIAPYLDGFSFLIGPFGRHGWDAVDALWAVPPTSTEQVMTRGAYPDHAPVPVRLPDLAAALGDGWTTLGERTLGQLVAATWASDGAPIGPLELSLVGRTVPGGDVGRGWGGDRAVTFDGPDGAWVLAWQTAWDSPLDAAEMTAAAAAVIDGPAGAAQVVEADLTGERLPNPVLVLVASDAATLGIAQDRLLGADGPAA